jgi:hypothetical protein
LVFLNNHPEQAFPFRPAADTLDRFLADAGDEKAFQLTVVVYDTYAP